MMTFVHRYRIAIWMAAASWMASTAPATAQEITVRAGIEKAEAFVGESVKYQIQILGSETPDPPDLSAFTDFTVEALGGTQNNSTSVTIVNGRMKRVVKRGYLFSYRLTPKRAGNLHIPSVEVTVEGRRFKTRAGTFQALKPEETDDFKLRVSLSEEECYVGQPIILNVTWYIAKDVKDIAFTIPILADPRFFSDDVEEAQHPNQEYYRVTVGSAETIAEKVQAHLDGRTYTALTFKKVLIPKEAGSFSFPEATVVCQALMGRRRSRSAFDGFFSDDFFSMGRRGSYRTFVIPSNSVTLEVAALPEEGRPRNFSGLVGRYRVDASAAPTKVNVGDPITLTIRVSGSDYLNHFELPPLQEHSELAKRFKIPVEMAPGKLEGAEKTFTQTIRALNDSVVEIPPIELNYFDTRSGQYKMARSDPLPLEVRATKVLTAEDAEGRELPPVRNQLTAWREGIAHNYEDPSVLENQAYGPGAVLRSPILMAFTGAPPLAYFLILGVVLIRRREHANPELRKVRKAHGQLMTRLRGLEDKARAKPGESYGETGESYGELLEALRIYLGGKLGVPGGALTYADAEKALTSRGAGRGLLTELQAIFEACEAHRYAGGHASEEDVPHMIGRIRTLAKGLEKEIKP